MYGRWGLPRGDETHNDQRRPASECKSSTPRRLRDMPPRSAGPAGATLLVLALMACSGGDSLDPSPPPATGTVMALGDRHVCLMRQGQTLCWGAGSDGQLGIGSTPVDTTPTALPGNIEFVALAAGRAHTCGLDASGAAFCWGSDRDGHSVWALLPPSGAVSFPAQRCPSRSPATSDSRR
jgi:hypothetical protein